MSILISLLQTWLLPAATFALALGTFILACYTRKMSKSTETALEQNARLVEETHNLVESNKVLVENEERHHQDLLKPLCTLLRSVENGTLENTSIFGDTNTMGTSLSIRASIVNKGVGPALNCECYFVIPGHCQYVRKNMPPLTINEKWCERNDLGDVVVFSYRHASSGQIIKTSIDEKDWAIYIQYYDILGKRYVIKHEPDYASGSILVSQDEDNRDLKERFICLP